MSDETVRVPAALVDALREKMNHYDWADALVAARALVDAAERPDEGEPCNYGAHFAGCKHEIPDDAPAAPVGDPLCKCGHAKDQWHPYGQCAWPCPCPAFTTAPLSSPRRTRDEGITLTDEERADLTAELADYTMDVRVDPNTVARIALGPVIAANIVEVVLRFRAARLAGEDDRG